MTKTLLGALAILLGTNYAFAGWEELEVDDPFNEDFAFLLYADETSQSDEPGRAPEIIYIECKKRYLRLYVLAENEKKFLQGYVRYKFDDGEIVEGLWENAGNGLSNLNVIRPIPARPSLGGEFVPTTTLTKQDFIDKLLVSESLIFEAGAISDDNRAYATFHQLSDGRDKLSEKLATCHR